MPAARELQRLRGGHVTREHLLIGLALGTAACAVSLIVLMVRLGYRVGL